MRSLALTALATLAACATGSEETATRNDKDSKLADEITRPMITLGNGERNSINPKGVTRDGATLTFANVIVDDDSWLVIHPFQDGKPNGDIYVGNTFLKAGHHEDVPVTVEGGAETGQMFLVMLHKDADQDGVFDFVFVNETTVEDFAVFEGSTMIAHIFAAP